MCKNFTLKKVMERSLNPGVTPHEVQNRYHKIDSFVRLHSESKLCDGTIEITLRYPEGTWELWTQFTTQNY